MDDIIRQVLQTLKDDFGCSIFSNSERFKSALNDVRIETDAKRIRNILTVAVCDMQAYSRMESALAANDIFIVGNLTEEMAKDYWPDKHDAKVVMILIAELLGYKSSNISRPFFEPPLPVGKPQPVSPPNAQNKPAQKPSYSPPVTSSADEVSEEKEKTKKANLKKFMIGVCIAAFIFAVLIVILNYFVNYILDSMKTSAFFIIALVIVIGIGFYEFSESGRVRRIIYVLSVILLAVGLFSYFVPFFPNSTKILLGCGGLGIFFLMSSMGD